MLDLFKIQLPDSITVSGSSYKIHTDFHYWINFARCLKTNDDISFIFKELPPIEHKDEIIEQLMNFYNPKEEIPRKSENQNHDVVLDYDIDADYIYSAFMEQYHIDLLDDKLRLHWWKFCALMKGLHDTKLDEIIGYRCYNPNDKTDHKQMMAKLKRQWRLPQQTKPLSPELEHFNSLFENK